jgi:hypothetical protein
MHTVCHLRTFERAAREVGLSEEDIEEIEAYLAGNPRAGDEIVGTGGCRKLRWRGGGKGKSGGNRIITFFTGDAMPVFLITVFGKGERADLTQSERNALKSMTKALVEEYRTRVRKVEK